jgi:hypothetical protein
MGGGEAETGRASRISVCEAEPEEKFKSERMDEASRAVNFPVGFWDDDDADEDFTELNEHKDEEDRDVGRVDDADAEDNDFDKEFGKDKDPVPKMF